MKIFFLFSTLICLIMSSCGRNDKRTNLNKSRKVVFKYAENISVERCRKFKIATLANPWTKGKTLHTYILVDRKDSATCGPLPDGTVIYTPLRRAVMFVSPHIALAGMLGATGNIAGVADTRFIRLENIMRKVKSGEITDCGESMNPNVERIIETCPDALFISPFENSGGYGNLEKTGIPIIECAEYMETSALGRAEWMRFYGMLLGKEHEADSLFALTESKYNELKNMAKQSKTRLSIITEKLTGTTWYVPGGRSSAGKLIADANGGYAFAADTHSGSLAMSFEAILDKAGNADVWVFNHSGTAPMTYPDLLSEYRGYESIKAFKNQNIWFVNSSQVPYFEEISFRPDFLLRDYIILLHPDLKIGKPKYFEKVIN